KHISILYTGDMMWGDPSIASCQIRMREAFENQIEAKKKGNAGREMVMRDFSYEKIGRIMKGRIESLCGVGGK
ncbi:MAG: hypothetical protein ABIC57_01165, partial [bacterium]